MPRAAGACRKGPRSQRDLKLDTEHLPDEADAKKFLRLEARLARFHFMQPPRPRARLPPLSLLSRLSCASSKRPPLIPKLDHLAAIEECTFCADLRLHTFLDTHSLLLLSHPDLQIPPPSSYNLPHNEGQPTKARRSGDDRKTARADCLRKASFHAQPRTKLTKVTDGPVHRTITSV